MDDCPEEDKEEQEEGITFVTHRDKLMIKAATLEKLVEKLYSENLGTAGTVCILLI